MICILHEWQVIFYLSNLTPSHVGSQSRTVYCEDTSDMSDADDAMCDDESRPVDLQGCDGTDCGFYMEGHGAV